MKRLIALVASAIFFSLPLAALYAHVDVESSVPAPDDQVTGPLDEVILVLTEPATPVPGAIQVLDGAGAVHEPDTITSDDSVTWRLTFEDPMAPGTVAVRWAMKAGDAHPKDGSFTFTLRSSIAAATDADPTGGQASMGGAEADQAARSEQSSASVALDEFLDQESERDLALAAGTLGRIAAMAGLVLAVGALVFAGFVLHGSDHDVRNAVFWIRRFATVGAIGAAVEFASLVVTAGHGVVGLLNPLVWVDVLATSNGFAVVLRTVGAAGILAGVPIVTQHAAEGVDPVFEIAERMPSQAVAGGSTATLVRPHSIQAVRLGKVASRWAFVAAIVAMASFAFDGHTVTEGSRLITSATTVVHSAGASVWVGGVAMLALTARSRHRRGVRPDIPELVVRFSVIAGIAVLIVGAAGVVLTWTIVDTPSDLWTTAWGRVLLMKVVLVSVAGGLGLHNHRTLIPAYLANPDRRGAYRDLRRSIAVEAALLGAVVLATAVLVASSSV